MTNNPELSETLSGFVQDDNVLDKMTHTDQTRFNNHGQIQRQFVKQ